MRCVSRLFFRSAAIALIAAGMVLAAVGVLMASATLPGAPDAERADAVDPAQPNAAGVPRALLPRASVPQMPGPPIPLDVKLVGTIAVEGGASFALVRTAYGSRVVGEGEEIVEHARLLQVQADQIVIEREGFGPEILPFFEYKPPADEVYAAEVLRNRAERAERLGSRSRQ
jgi:hypothetical protein